mmetsp:Transcript_15905/g.23430  ORF Transcript_15905/g.23430 Transcript_15905/m.23430 type:complete len:238 (+) Transcript_15905:1475-2188(+)
MIVAVAAVYVALFLFLLSKRRLRGSQQTALQWQWYSFHVTSNSEKVSIPIRVFRFEIPPLALLALQAMASSLRPQIMVDSMLHLVHRFRLDAVGGSWGSTFFLLPSAVIAIKSKLEMGKIAKIKNQEDTHGSITKTVRLVGLCPPKFHQNFEKRKAGVTIQCHSSIRYVSARVTRWWHNTIASATSYRTHHNLPYRTQSMLRLVHWCHQLVDTVVQSPWRIDHQICQCSFPSSQIGM